MYSCGCYQGHFELLVPMIQKAKERGVVDSDYHEASGCYYIMRARRDSKCFTVGISCSIKTAGGSCGLKSSK